MIVDEIIIALKEKLITEEHAKELVDEYFMAQLNLIRSRGNK